MKSAQITTALKELNVSFKAVNVIGILWSFVMKKSICFC